MNEIVEPQAPHVYDPTKKYTWEPETKFLLEGQEFGVILNSLRAFLNTPDAQIVLLANRANLAIEEALSRAVSIGIVKEDTTSTPKKDYNKKAL